MLTSILVIILAWGTPHDPTLPTRQFVTAHAINDVARDRDEAALMLTIIRHESNLEYYVHAGLPSPIGTQDGGRARCLGQIHRVPTWWTYDEWRALAGTSYRATVRCVHAIQRVLDYHARRCNASRHTWSGVGRLLAAYWDGHTCTARTTRGQRSRLHYWNVYRRLL